MTRSPHVWTITVDVVGRNVATACPSGARFKSAGAKTVKLLAFEHRVPGGVLAELHLGARDAAVRRTSGGR
jgi:hypothetical protein